MELANQLIDHTGAVLVGRPCQLGVACGSGGAGVPEQPLDMAQA